jgi:hypothetical protein
MRRLIIAFVALASFNTYAFPRLAINAGLAVDNRFQKDVNPANSDNQLSGQVFATARHQEFSALAEVGLATNDGKSGSYTTSRSTWSSMLWGRYHFNKISAWEPIVGAGLGMNIDRIESNFGGVSDRRNGFRGMIGLGVGLAIYTQKNIFFEGEVRMLGIRGQENLTPAMLIRAGITL